MTRTRPAHAPEVLHALAVSSAALAAARGSPQLQIFFAASMPSAYQQKAFSRFAKSWKQPAQVPQPGKKTVVQALLSRDGKVVSAFVSDKSGSAPWDAAALAAVKKAAPFDPLPAKYELPTVEVHFHVEWAAAK